MIQSTGDGADGREAAALIEEIDLVLERVVEQEWLARSEPV